MVRVNIEPGLVQTEIFRDWDEVPKAQFDIPNPLQPEDMPGWFALS